MGRLIRSTSGSEKQKWFKCDRTDWLAVTQPSTSPGNAERSSTIFLIFCNLLTQMVVKIKMKQPRSRYVSGFLKFWGYNNRSTCDTPAPCSPASSHTLSLHQLCLPGPLCLPVVWSLCFDFIARNYCIRHRTCSLAALGSRPML